MLLCSSDTNHLSHSPCPTFDYNPKGWQPHEPVSVLGWAWPVWEMEEMCGCREVAWQAGRRKHGKAMETQLLTPPKPSCRLGRSFAHVVSCAIPFFCCLPPLKARLPQHLWRHTRINLLSVQWYLPFSPFPGWMYSLYVNTVYVFMYFLSSSAFT